MGTEGDSAVAGVSRHGVPEPIAIVGIGCRFPCASGPQEFWQFILEERDAITEVPKDRFDIDFYFDPQPGTPGKLISRAGGFLDDIDRFAASFFGISPREASHMDPQQRLLLEVAWEAFEDAGIVPDSLEGSDTGVFVGNCYGDYDDLLMRQPTELDIYSAVGACRSVLSGRISYALGLEGPSLSVDTACSSSLVAAHLACQSLWEGDCHIALAAGVNLVLEPEQSMGFSRAGMLSPDGRCKFGDADANGFVRSDGAGVVVLKPLSRAKADGDRVYAVIRGGAVNNDGRSSGYLMTPGVDGQKAVLRRAYSRSGVAPSDIQYVEAHGTGTKAGDPVELEALHTVIGEGRPLDRPCFVGSIKSNIGHTEGAAGIAGLIKTALSVHHSVVPASLHVRELNPAISWDTLALEIPTERMPWPEIDGPRRAGVSSFGISGTNAHLVLEEAPQRQAATSESRGSHLLTISAENANALRELADGYVSFLQGTDESLAAVCSAAIRHRTHHAERLAVVASTVDESREAIQSFTEGKGRAGTAHGRVEQRNDVKIVFVFPGQGSQWLGMGRELLRTEPVFLAEIERCDAAMRQFVTWSLTAELCADEAASRLDEIDVIQPALFAVEVALAALWRSWGIEPAAVIGHSMGEVAAGYVAGALSLEDAARIICRRSQLLLRVSGKGAMAVVEQTVEQAEAAIAGYEDRVSIAVSNSPTSTVLSGDPATITSILESLERDGVFCRLVKVDVASHSPQMDELEPDLLTALEGVAPRAGSIEVASTVTATVGDGSAFDAEYWVQNLRQPVRFAGMVQELLARGYGIFLEMSPNPLLLSAVQQTARNAGRECLALPSLRRQEDERAVMLSSVGELYVQGYPLDWTALYPHRHHVSLPRYPWQRESFWLPTESARRTRGDIAGVHPLLGMSVKSAVHGDAHVWELELDRETLPYLADHQVRNQVVVPASAFVEMALAATAEVFGGGIHRLEQVQLTEALMLPPEGTRTVQTVLTGSVPGSATFKCFSQGKDDASSQWTLHASSRIVLETTADVPKHEPIAEIEQRCRKEVSTEEHYRITQNRGLHYGPAFQGVEHTVASSDEALATIRLPQDVERDASRYAVHPSLLDACFQVLYERILTATEDGEGALYLPVSIGSVRHCGAPRVGSWSHAVLESGVHPGANRVEGDSYLLDDEGHVVVEARGLVFQRVEPDSAPAIHEWLYTLQWEPIEPSTGDLSACAPGQWLILADSGDVGQTLTALLERHGRRAVVVKPGERFERFGPREYAVHPGSVEDMRVVLAEAFGTQDDPCSQIVHLWSLDATQNTDATPASLERAQMMGSMNVVHLVQAVAEAGWKAAPRLSVVTRGSQMIEGIDENRSVAQAPVFGVGRVVVNEHPELACRRIDLAAAAMTQEVDRLLAELAANDANDEVALRESGRYAHHLVRYSVGEAQRSDTIEHVSPDTPYRLETVQPGLLDHLVLRQIERRVPGPREVEIHVHAAGLNFRDVMAAMGLMSDYADGVGPLGRECSGVVTAVGSEVENIQVGDEVLAVGDNTFASYVTTHAHLVVPKPSHIGFLEGVTIPVTFLTAYFALIHQGRLTRGERVLIHAASGGVGLAAVQVAQQAGAKIFATAGSPEKRAYLRSHGIKHVMDSRSLDYANQIMRLTNGQGVDVILNSLSGDFIPASLSVLAPFGRFLEIGKTDIYQDSQLGLLPFKRSLSFQSIDLDRMFRERIALIGSLLQDVMRNVAEGVFSPLPTEIFGIDETQDAFRHMAQAKHIGKIVISMQVDAVPVAQQQQVICSDSTYLITGGLGGLGLAVARWMVEQGARHLVLVGRRGVTAEVEPTLAELRAMGAAILVASVDVAQESEVVDLLGAIEGEMPPLRGIIHSAGVLDDGVILQQSWERFQRVMAPKIAGSWNLHHLTQHLPLDFFVLFSSGAGLVGSPGQGNYVAANEFLDALAHARRAQGLPATSINWGAWSDVGLAARPDRGGRLATRGMKSLTPAQGVAAFEEVMRVRPAQIAVMPMDWPQWLEAYPSSATSSLLAHLVASSQHTSKSIGAKQPGQVLEELRALDPAGQFRALEMLVVDSVVKVLGLAMDRVDTAQPLVRLGLDSLMALELRSRIESVLGVSLPKQIQQYSVSHLADELLKSLDTGKALGVPRSTDPDPVVGPVPLTPRQRWFLERGEDHPHQISSLILQSMEEIDPERLELAFHHLLRHHDALRMRFKRESGVWHQSNAETESHRIVTYLNVVNLKGRDIAEASRRAREASRNAINMVKGPLVQAVLVDWGRDRQKRLIVQIHHLILDGVAIRVLVEDLNLVYKQLCRGESVRLPAKTTSYRTWAERLLGYAHTPEVEADIDYWLGQPWSQAAVLPMDGTLRAVGGGRVASVRLNEQETSKLLRGAAEDSDGGIQPWLLAATVQSIAEWTHCETHLVNMWSHGRDPFFPDIDLSRTVGWCTAEYPVLLSIAPDVSLHVASESARRQLAAVPHGGISYDLLRHLHTSTSIRERMRALPTPCITFNYQGKYAETLTTSGPLMIDDAHVHDAKPYLDQVPLSPDLNISSKIVAGSLTIVLRCHSNAYEQHTLDRVASDLHQRIRSLHAATERVIDLSAVL